MKTIKAIILLFFVLISSGCNIYQNPSEVASLNTKIPFKDASLIHSSVNKNDIVVAAEIPNSDIQNRMFSESLSSTYIPILITITNNSNKRIFFNQANIKTKTANLKPVPLVEVIESLQGHFWLTIRMIFGAPLVEGMNEKQRRDEAVVVNMYNKTIKPSIIQPQQTIQGYLFFDSQKAGHGRYKIITNFQKLRKVEYFNVETSVTDMRD
jgi:hypothetical protein